MHYTVWIHCCKWPNYDFCILQGSVATLLRCGGLWAQLKSFMSSFKICTHCFHSAHNICLIQWHWFNSYPAVQVQYALTISPPGPWAESLTTAAQTLYGFLLIAMDGVTVVAKRPTGLPWLMGWYSTSFTQPAAKYLHKTSILKLSAIISAWQVLVVQQCWSHCL